MLIIILIYYIYYLPTIYVFILGIPLIKMGVTEKFCLKWNDFESNISHSFRELREDKDFFDLTLACDDENQISAHKVILAACSPFFRSILRRNKHEHPLLYLKGIKHTDLTAVLNFMYHGEVNVAQEDLNSFLAVAEELKVKGLTQQKKSEEKKENSSLSHPVTTPKSSTKSKLSRDSSSISGGEDSNSASFSQPPTKKARAQPSLSQHTSYPSTSNDSDEIQEIIPVKSEPSSSRAMPPTIPITDSTEDDSNLVMQGGGGYPETAQNYPGDYEDYGEGGYEDEGAFEEPMMDNMNSSVSVDPSKGKNSLNYNLKYSLG